MGKNQLSIIGDSKLSNLITSDSNYEIKEVEFENSKLIVLKELDSNNLYVGINYICCAIGVNFDTQWKKIQEDEVLARGVGSHPLPTSGGVHISKTLHIDFLPLWLAGINIKLVRDEVKPKLVEFKLKAKDVLAEAFNLKNKDFSELSSLEMLKEYQKMVAIAIEKEEKIIELKLILSEKDRIIEKYKLEFDEGLVFVSEISNQIGIGVIKFSDILKYLDIVKDSTKTVSSKYTKYFNYTLTLSNKLMVAVLKVNSNGLILLDDLVYNGLFQILNPKTNLNYDADSINSLKRTEIPTLILANRSNLDLILNKY